VASTPQAGIFALGTASHAYLELDMQEGTEGPALVAGVASLREPRTTMGGVNLVAGFRPELWRAIVPHESPATLEGFNRPIVGADFTMPATQHDAVLWISGSAYDVVFDVARQAIAALRDVARIAEETSSWPYHHDRDLTGFIDGTENPTLIEAPDLAVIPESGPGAGGSILLLQKWAHDAASWEAQPTARQESVIGRNKLDSAEIEDKPADSHVARTDQDLFGKIFRRNMPYGTVTAAGCDARKHGRGKRWRPRHADVLRDAVDWCVLLHPFDPRPNAIGRPASMSSGPRSRLTRRRNSAGG